MRECALPANMRRTPTEPKQAGGVAALLKVSGNLEAKKLLQRPVQLLQVVVGKMA